MKKEHDMSIDAAQAEVLVHKVYNPTIFPEYMAWLEAKQALEDAIEKRDKAYTEWLAVGYGRGET